MVNVEMFKDAFRLPSEQPSAPLQPKPQPQPKQVMAPEDPDIARLKFMMLKWLSIIVGGGALALIVWRIALKFFG